MTTEKSAPQPVPAHTPGPMRSRAARFEPRLGGRQIDDADFNHDALLRIDGDFGSDEERMAYARLICDRLNAPAAIQAPEGAPAADVADRLERYNAWRRGDSGGAEMPDPREIGEAIDAAVAMLKGAPAGMALVGWQYRDANDDGTWTAWLGCDKRLEPSQWRQVRGVYAAGPAAEPAAQCAAEAHSEVLVTMRSAAMALNHLANNSSYSPDALAYATSLLVEAAQPDVQPKAAEGDEPTLDEVLRLADEHAEDSYENGDRRFDRGGVYQFAKDLLRLYGEQDEPQPKGTPFGYVSEHNCEGPFKYQFHTGQKGVYLDNCKSITPVYAEVQAPAPAQTKEVRDLIAYLKRHAGGYVLPGWDGHKLAKLIEAAPCAAVGDGAKPACQDCGGTGVDGDVDDCGKTIDVPCHCVKDAASPVLTDEHRLDWLCEEAEFTCGQWQVVIESEAESFIDAVDEWAARAHGISQPPVQPIGGGNAG